MYVLIVRNNSNPQAVDASLLLVTYFTSQSIDFDTVDVTDLYNINAEELVAEHADQFNLAVVLGGDGTILRTARFLEAHCVPILGINFGHLGFLANACEESIVDMVTRALADELTCERRANLRIDVVCVGDVDPFDDEGASDAMGEDTTGECNDASGVAHSCNAAPDMSLVNDDGSAASGVITDGLYGRRSFFALNEVVVTRGAMGRMIDLSLNIADSHIADMRGDGIVIATATGSTAYALSAGGPIVAPAFSGLITVPLLPHTLHSRTILTGDNDVVCVTLAGRDVTREATLFIDGDLLVFDRPVRRVYARRGSDPTLLLRSQGEGFYEYASQTFF